MSKLLVTGGAGFIGSNFVHYWLQQHPADLVVVLDALTYAGNKHNLDACHSNANFRFVHGSINDQALVENLLSRHSIDTLVHFAAESHVDRSISGPDAFLETNILGTHSLLKAARKVWSEQGGFAGKRFHHVSTDEVYGTLGPQDPAFTEETQYAPNSPYAASKAASDHLVRAYHHTYGLPVTTSNCSNNYGPFHFPEKLLPLCLLNILQGKPLPIYGDGMQVRDWLYVEDHNRGIELILQKGVVGETYNIGGNNEWANLNTVKLLCGIVDKAFTDDKALAQRFPNSPCAKGAHAESLITFVNDRPGHDTRYAINASKLRNELGYEPRTTFQAGLTATVQWYLRNEPWWRGIQDQSYRY
jgi:dTDP-glucose 4,6-dehydratase